MPKDDLADLRLDLAPKLNRPLSLWNPLDYLRLLFWVFYFPQALRWYVDRFGSHDSFFKSDPTRGKLLNSLSKRFHNCFVDRVQRNLLIQGIISTTFFSLAFRALLLSNILISQNLIFAYWENILFTILICVALSIAIGVGASITFSIVFFTMASISIDTIRFTLAIAVNHSTLGSRDVDLIAIIGINNYLIFTTVFMASISFSLVAAYISSASISKNLVFAWPLDSINPIFIPAFIFFPAFIFQDSWSTMVDHGSGFQSLLTFAFLFLMTVFLSIFAAFTRLENWILLSALILLSKQISGKISPAIGSVTLLPLPYVRNFLELNSLEKCHNFIGNLENLSVYTNQFFWIFSAFEDELNQLPDERILEGFSRLSQFSIVWNLLGRSKAFSPFPRLYLDTPAHATAAGFWYLHEEQPAEAAQAFAVVRDIRHGDEMHGLASLLALFDTAETVEQIAAIELPDLPRDRTLRPQTWEAIRRFYHVISDTKTAQASASSAARAFAAIRAIGDLQQIIDNEAELPEAERSLIVKIASTWSVALRKIASEVGASAITQPVQNPYVIGDPVEGDLFVGRDDIMRQLQELWLMGNHLQSVVIYGHRRMGKTSILKNIESRLGSGIHVAYVNLLKSAGADNLSDVLLAISDQVATTLAIAPPLDSDMETSPARTFERFLRRATHSLANGKGLIIALDEFEKIEELINAGKLEASFMAYLRGLVQDSPRVGFAFAGLHTLQEMSADYFQPFFASVIPIKVDFFKPATVQTLLPNPGGDFPLDYDYDALDLIWALTAGQPYLTQLIGFQLVRRYNDQVFERQQPREAQFTVEDVEAVVNQPEFFAQGRPYFAGVWAQANHDAPGQQTLLRALAPHPQGLLLEDLQAATNLDSDRFTAALTTLENHDVIRHSDGRVSIIVAVFRRWVLEQGNLSMRT